MSSRGRASQGKKGSKTDRPLTVFSPYGEQRLQRDRGGPKQKIQQQSSQENI